jgi:hypothetical protein
MTKGNSVNESFDIPLPLVIRITFGMFQALIVLFVINNKKKLAANS